MMRLLLIDFSGLYWAAWHAVGNDGLDAPGRRVRERIAELAEGFERVALCLDHGSWRYELLPAYKANRPPKPEAAVLEMERVKADLARRYPCASAANYEADDVMATLARFAVGAGHDVTVASGDKDMLQLVGPGCRVLSTITGSVYATADDVVAKMGVRPEQIADFLALAGDSADGIPGVPGIGPKGAAGLLAEGRSMTDLAVLMDDRSTCLADGRAWTAPPWLSPKAAEKIAAAWESVMVYRRITALAYDAPIDCAGLLSGAPMVASEPPANDGDLEANLRASVETTREAARMGDAAPQPEHWQRDEPLPMPQPRRPETPARGPMMFQKATKKAAKLRLAMAGPSGSGKTYSALRIAQAFGSRIALIDTERGSASKYAGDPGIPDFDTADVAPPYGPDRLIEMLGSVSDYDVVIVDSITHFWKGTGGFLELIDAEVARMKSRGNKGDSFAAWKVVDPVYRRLIEAIVGCSAHVICCVRAKTAYEKREVNGRNTVERVGMEPEMREGFEYEFDAFGMLDVDHRMVIQKTRCPAIDGAIVDKPGPAFAAPILGWLAGERSPGDVAELAMVAQLRAATTSQDLDAVAAAIGADAAMGPDHKARLRGMYKARQAEIRTIGSN